MSCTKFIYLSDESKNLNSENLENIYPGDFESIIYMNDVFTKFYEKNLNEKINDLSKIPIAKNKGYYMPNLKINENDELVLLLPSSEKIVETEIIKVLNNIQYELEINVCNLYFFDFMILRRMIVIQSFEKIIVLQNKKRGRVDNFESNKKINTYISPSRLRDAVNDDYLLTYAKLAHSKGEINKFFNNNVFTDDVFIQKIFKQGIDYENFIVDKLKLKCKDNFIQIAPSSKNCDEFHCQKTIEAMKKGYIIIYQAVLINDDNTTKGCCDLIIRSDYINEILNDKVLDKEEEHKGCILNDNFHYLAVDIKSCNLSKYFSQRSYKELTNSGDIKYPKLQVTLYSKSLEYIQKYFPKKAIIMAKNYDGIDFGLVSFDDNLSCDYPNKLNDFLSNIKLIIENYNKIKLYDQPTYDFLRPNMKSKSDYFNIKKIMADYYCDPTSIYYIGPKERNLALKHGITSFKDNRLNSKLMGFKENSVIGKRVDNILKVNRTDDFLQIPEKIISNMFDWRNTTKYFDCYVDFEYFNSVFSSQFYNKTNDYNFSELVFMIGIGYKNSSNDWIFNSFVINKKNKNEEIRIFNELNKLVLELEKKFNKKIRFVHYNHTEKTEINKFCDKYNGLKFNVEYLDIYKILQTENFAVNGSRNYSLKNICKALNKHNKIDCVWPDGCSDGLQAMVFADECYNNNIDIESSSVMDKIKKYNEIDCKSMYELLTYLRTSC